VFLPLTSRQRGNAIAQAIANQSGKYILMITPMAAQLVKETFVCEGWLLSSSGMAFVRLPGTAGAS